MRLLQGKNPIMLESQGAASHMVVIYHQSMLGSRGTWTLFFLSLLATVRKVTGKFIDDF